MTVLGRPVDQSELPGALNHSGRLQGLRLTQKSRPRGALGVDADCAIKILA